MATQSPFNRYVPRLLDAALAAALGAFPAVMVVGPRAVGKTTTARRLAADVLRLDRPAEAAAVAADPDAVLARLDRPALIDEWQVVDTVLGAVKRAVDDDPRAGQWMLTGSVRAQLDAVTWPGTGRVVQFDMEPMTLAERQERPLEPTLLDQVWEDGGEGLIGRRAEMDLGGYAEAIIHGGLPPLLTLSAPQRARWLYSYVEQLVTRDAYEVGDRDPQRLRRYVQATAATTGQAVEHKVVYDAAGIDRRTALAYDDLLVALGVVTPLPAFQANELKRLTKTPKRHLRDPALAGPTIGIDAAAVLRDGRLLGSLFETFVVLHLRAVAAAGEIPVRLFHLREQDHEIDVILERPDRRLIAVETKATAAPDRADAAHLRWLRQRLGDRIAATLLVHTGTRAFPLGDGVIAVPLAALA